MRRYYTLAIIAATLLIAGSCTEKPDNSTQAASKRPMTFQISGIGPDTLYVYDGIEWECMTKNRGIADDAYCTKAYESEQFYCILPFDKEYIYIDGKVKVTIPQNQKTSVGQLDSSAYFHAGSSIQNLIEMKPLCSIVKFTLQNEGIKIIRLSGKAGERIAGRHSISFERENKVCISPALGVDDWTNILLSPGDSSAFKAGEWNIVIFPRKFNDGISLEFASTDGKTEQIDFPAFELISGESYNLGEIRLDWNQEPDIPVEPDQPDQPGEPDQPDVPIEPEVPDDRDEAGTTTEKFEDGDEYKWNE